MFISLRVLGVAVLSALLILGVATAQDKGKDKNKDKTGKSKVDPDGKDDKKGRARWEWILSDTKGKELARGTIDADVQGTVYHGKSTIGSFTQSGGNSQLKVKFSEGRLKGTAELRLTVKKPATYEGELSRADGARERLFFVIVDD